MRRKLTIFVPLLSFILVVTGLYFGLFQDPNSLPSPLVGKEAPNIRLPIFSTTQLGVVANDTGGARIPILSIAKNSSGRAPMVVNFFASWCVPCRAEAGALAALRQKIDAAKLDIRVVGIAYKDSPENIARFLKEYGNPYDQVFTDQDGRGGIDYGVYGIPESFLINRGGLVDHRYTGALQLDSDIDFIIKHFAQN